MNGFHTAPFPPPRKSRSFNLRGDRNELGHSRLDEIARAIRTLTYGEMLELAEAMWKVNSRGSEITESDLPGVAPLVYVSALVNWKIPWPWPPWAPCKEAPEYLFRNFWKLFGNAIRKTIF
jgi:hypothetical protein